MERGEDWAASLGSVQSTGMGARAIGAVLPRRGSTAGGRLLRVPVRIKILAANGVLVALVAAAVIGVRGAPGASGSSGALPAVVLAVGVCVSVAVNWVILTLALSPLRMLESTAERVRSGDVGARAAVSLLADRNLEQLIGTFNAMLDDMALDRRRLSDVVARSQSLAEAEFRRLALELHDELAQTLAALRVQLRVARGTADNDEREGRFDELGATLGDVIEDVRRISQGLRPAALDDLGVGAALASYARPLAEAAGMEIDIQTVPTAGAIARDAELVLYRIAQEALSNVVEHSGASHVSLILQKKSHVVELVIDDDGRGFDVAEAVHGPGGGLGLLGMEERARRVGGRVETSSEPGRGTRVTVTVPLTEWLR